MPAQASEPKASSVPAVTVVEVKKVCFVDTLQVTGILVPRQEILVRPERDLLEVTELLVQPGDIVVAGQVLARLRQITAAKDPGPDVAVRAPDAGVVYAVSVVLGATVGVAGEPLFKIAKNGDMELASEIPVGSISRLAKGQSAAVEVIGVGQLQSSVQHIGVAINQVTQLGEVRLPLAKNPRLRVGAFARGNIEIEQRCSPAVPLSAVLYGEDGAVIQVVRGDRIESRQVTVGSIKDKDAEIREGLVLGDIVVWRAGAFLRDGDRVRTISASQSSGLR